MKQGKRIDENRRDPELGDLSDAEIVGFCFFRWCAEQHMRGPKQLKTAI
jgi:hypothetical protein